jgi:hypothetical protein
VKPKTCKAERYDTKSEVDRKVESETKRAGRNRMRRKVNDVETLRRATKLEKLNVKGMNCSPRGRMRKEENQLKKSKTQRRVAKPDEVKREDLICKRNSTRSKRNDSQRNETREAESKGMNEPQPRASRAKEESVTKEDESATMRNDAVEIECGGISSSQGRRLGKQRQRHRRRVHAAEEVEGENERRRKRREGEDVES